MMRKLAVIIPARDEEKVLESCLKELLKVMDKKDIYLVNDDSSDNSGKIAKKYLKNILICSSNIGKANCINKAIRHFNLISKYQFIFPLDADTKIDQSFVSNILKVFETDKKREIVAVVGRIKGKSTSATSAYRVWEYEVSQIIHKNAQNKLNAILVCSGCSTVYRSKIFQKIQFSDHTLTEDMDLTFTIHRKNLGKIVYAPTATVETQDPQTLGDLKKQLDRWYGGFWQCVIKHKIPFGRSGLDLEVGLAAFEGVFSGLFVLSLLIFLPILLFKAYTFVLIGLMLDLVLFTLPSLFFVALRQRDLTIFKYVLHFYALRIFSSLIFLKSYFVQAFGLGSKIRWHQAERFSLKRA